MWQPASELNFRNDQSDFWGTTFIASRRVSLYSLDQAMNRRHFGLVFGGQGQTVLLGL